MEEKRTYGWYASHGFLPSSCGHKVYDTMGPSVNAPRHDLKVKHLTEMGVIDQVPTVDNLRPLLERYVEWESRWRNDWSEYEKERNGPLETIHWILGPLIEDPTQDPEVLRLIVTMSPGHSTRVGPNPRCPSDILDWMFTVNGTKKDPTGGTKGGEVVCFILHNCDLSSDLVDRCARSTKRASIQNDVVRHKNVSRETLVFLSDQGRSSSVKKNALSQLVKRGWITVK